MTSPEEQPRPAAGAAPALARRHDEHVREPLGPPDDGPARRVRVRLDDDFVSALGRIRAAAVDCASDMAAFAGTLKVGPA